MAQYYDDPMYQGSGSVRPMRDYVLPVGAIGMGARSLTYAARPPVDSMNRAAGRSRTAAYDALDALRTTQDTSRRNLRNLKAQLDMRTRVAGAKTRTTAQVMPKMLTPKARLKRAGVGATLVAGGGLTLAAMRRKDRDG